MFVVQVFDIDFFTHRIRSRFPAARARSQCVSRCVRADGAHRMRHGPVLVVVSRGGSGGDLWGGVWRESQSGRCVLVAVCLRDDRRRGWCVEKAEAVDEESAHGVAASEDCVAEAAEGVEEGSLPRQTR